MIKPEQVPKEVAWKLQDKLFRSGVSADECTHAIAAALNAWPGAAVCHYTVADDEGYEIVLPLPFPQEASDD